MASLNKVMLIGNLTRDPELRHTPRGTAVCELSLAINRTWKDDSGQKQEEVTFIDVTLWGNAATTCAQYMVKGRGIYIEGRLQLESWEDKETGARRTKLKVTGESFQFLPHAGGPQPAHSGRAEGGSSGSAPSIPPPSAEEEDDIPF